MLKALDLGWLAGIIDGEGCYQLCKRKKRTHSQVARITLGMTDRDTVERVASMFKAKVGFDSRAVKNPNHKDSWRISITGKKAAAWMMTLYPLMSERRKGKIRECLAAWQSSTRHWRGTMCPNGHDKIGANALIAKDSLGRSYVRCRTCVNKSNRRANKAWRDRNPELVKQRTRDQYAKNPEAALRASKRWRLNNPEKALASCRKSDARPERKLRAHQRYLERKAKAVA